MQFGVLLQVLFWGADVLLSGVYAGVFVLYCIVLYYIVLCLVLFCLLV